MGIIVTLLAKLLETEEKFRKFRRVQERTVEKLTLAQRNEGGTVSSPVPTFF